MTSVFDGSDGFEADQTQDESKHVRHLAAVPALVVGAVALVLGAFVAGTVWGSAAVRSISPTLAQMLGYEETVKTGVPAPSDGYASLLSHRLAAVVTDASSAALKVPNVDEATAGVLTGYLRSGGDEAALVLDQEAYERLIRDRGLMGNVPPSVDGGVSSLLSGTFAEVSNDDESGEGRDADNTDAPSASAEALDPRQVNATLDPRGVGVVRFDLFAPGVANNLAQAVSNLEEQGASSIVIDLRANTGGSVQEAMRCASLFLTGGTVVELVLPDGTTRLAADAEAHVTNLPVAVLVSHETAGAAEEFVAALQEHARASVVGQRTYGRGTAQRFRTLSFGGAVSYTVAELFTPDGHRIEGEGIQPDVEVALPEETSAASTTTHATGDGGVSRADDGANEGVSTVGEGATGESSPDGGVTPSDETPTGPEAAALEGQEGSEASGEQETVEDAGGEGYSGQQDEPADLDAETSPYEGADSEQGEDDGEAPYAQDGGAAVPQGDEGSGSLDETSVSGDADSRQAQPADASNTSDTVLDAAIALLIQ